MADQAKVSAADGPRETMSAAGEVVSNIADLGSEVAKLVELQGRMYALELGQAIRRAIVPAVGLGIGLALCLGAFPVALIGVSQLVAESFAPAHRGWAYVIVAAAGALFALLLCWVSLARLRKFPEAFQKSRAELERNIAWLWNTIATAGQTARSGRM
jgi:uncharacterized membrane protein YqjE